MNKLKDVEIMPDISEKELKYQSISNKIFDEFENQREKYGYDAEELKKIGERQSTDFRFILKKVGDQLFRYNDVLKDKSVVKYNNKYNIELLDYLYGDTYKDLCDMYHKNYDLGDYFKMIGCSRNVLYRNGKLCQELNDEKSALRKRIREDQEEQFNRNFRDSNVPLKNIAFANHNYNWDGKKTEIEEKPNKPVSIEELRTFFISMKDSDNTN